MAFAFDTARRTPEMLGANLAESRDVVEYS